MIEANTADEEEFQAVHGFLLMEVKLAWTEVLKATCTQSEGKGSLVLVVDDLEDTPRGPHW